MAVQEQRIRIARKSVIVDNRITAELLLQDRPFLKGEFVMINYYKDPDFRTNIGVLIALGVKDGTGEDCFRIVSMGVGKFTIHINLQELQEQMGLGYSRKFKEVHSYSKISLLGIDGFIEMEP